MKKIILNFGYFLFIFCAFSFYLNAESDDESKTYVNFEKIHLTDEGIFLINNDSIIQVESIFCDSHGYYIKNRDIREHTCMNGHPIYHNCGGCANWWCNFRCKCNSPWTDHK